MGQQAAASGTWRSQNKPTSRDSYETMGQQTRQRNLSHPAMEADHVKNSKSRFETDRKIPSENERKSSDFAPYGTAVKRFHPDVQFLDLANRREIDGIFRSLEKANLVVVDC